MLSLSLFRQAARAQAGKRGKQGSGGHTNGEKKLSWVEGYAASFAGLPPDVHKGRSPPSPPPASCYWPPPLALRGNYATMSRHCVSVLLLVCIAPACLAFVPSWTATFRSSRSQPPASTPAAATSSLSQPSGATCLVLGTFGACGAHMVYPVRGITRLSALSEGNEEAGRGDHDTREAAGGSPAADEIRAVQDETRGVERKIEDVEKETEEIVKKIDDVEAAIAGSFGYLGITDPESPVQEGGAAPQGEGAAPQGEGAAPRAAPFEEEAALQD